MPDRAAKNALFDALAAVAKALGSGRRAEMVELLAQGERPVDAIAEAIEQSVANTSSHLQHLARAGLVTSRRDGTRIYYRLTSSRVAELWAALRDVASEHVAGLDTLARAYLGDRSRLEAMTRDELLHRLDERSVILLDVRPEPEYEAGHIVGAESAPVAALKGRLPHLDPSWEIVAYCRGPFCVYADDAVRLLQREGFTARRLEDGFPEWARAGLPTARGPASSNTATRPARRAKRKGAA